MLELILKRTKHLFLWLVLVCSLTALAEKPKGGRLVVEGPYRVSLGEFPAEQSRTVAYTLKNVGDAPIGIMSVSRACGCADAFMTTNVVDKGASVGITFKTYPDKLPGAFVKTFYVITDSPDPRTKLVQLVVTGNGIVTKGRGTNGVAAARSENVALPLPGTSSPHLADSSQAGRAWVSDPAAARSENVALPYTNSFHSFNSVIKYTPYSELTDNVNRLDVEFFVQEGCAECLVLRRDYLPSLANRYAYRVRTSVSDTHSVSTFLRLLEKLEACGIKANEPVYMVVGGEKVLSGWGEIAKSGYGAIDKALSPGNLEPQNPQKTQKNASFLFLTGFSDSFASAWGYPGFEGLEFRIEQSYKFSQSYQKKISSAPPRLCEKMNPGSTAGTAENAAARLFRRFGWAAVAIAGLADGLNPCAFATIVFLTSILASGGRRGRAVFMGGLAFCVASFVTYFLIGFGLLSALRRLEGLTVLRFIVEWGTVAALMILGALSLLDAWRYSRTGEAGSVRLQLPAGVKQRIRGFARARWGGAAVFGTGLFCGAGVTLLESVCTGQMYLPTLVFMSREGGGFRAWGMLLLYNVLFVVPLFAVFMLGAFGVRSQRLAVLTRRNVVPSKILLAVVFFSLAAFLLAYALEHG